MRAWLKDLRKNKRLTQTQVAKNLGLKQNYYCEIENGKKQLDLNLSVATKIADFFSITLDDIAKFEESRGERRGNSTTTNKTT